MILKQKEHLDPKLKEDLKQYVYDIVGYVFDVLKELPCGMPEYLYQEGFAKVLKSHGIDPHKEYQCHPIFMGELTNEARADESSLSVCLARRKKTIVNRWNRI